MMILALSILQMSLGCNGRGQGHVTHILKFWSSSNIFGISEAKQFKFRVPTDIVIGGQKIKYGSHYPDHAHFKGNTKYQQWDVLG